MKCAQSPRAAPVCHTEPAQSGRSWICAGLRGAASQSELAPDLHHYTGKEKERQRHKGMHSLQEYPNTCLNKCFLLQLVHQSFYAIRFMRF